MMNVPNNEIEIRNYIKKKRNPWIIKIGINDKILI